MLISRLNAIPFSRKSPTTPIPPDPGDEAVLLLEDGSNLLLENNENILLENQE